MGYADGDGHQEYQEGEGPAQTEDRGRGEVRGLTYLMEMCVCVMCVLCTTGSRCGRPSRS
jgi:hypothetical protein